ncbi:MAG: protein kinase, partial [Chloroflexi bacterium]|nr:protein kinase [Chloroflexota bacterium]
MLTVGQILQDRYTIEAVMGQGGMGAVYQARDVSLKAPCVVKELLLPAQTSQLANLAEQFQREASILANLRHPNLPRVSNFFLEQGNYYLVMDLIKGQSLSKLIGTTGLAEATVLDYAGQLLGVLEYIHGQGVLHRDIKPNNVIIQPDGRAILVDFGLVKIIDGEKTSATMTFLHGMGTPAYAPPEQFTGGTDQRSDIYSLGGLLYQALTGQSPPMALNRLGGAPLVPLRQIKKGISPSTERAVMKALELKASDRFQSATQFRAALFGKNATTARMGEQSPQRNEPVSNRLLVAAVIVCGVLLLAVGAFVISQLAIPAAPAVPTVRAVIKASVTAQAQVTNEPAQAADVTSTATEIATPTPAGAEPSPTPSITDTPAPTALPVVINVGNTAHLQELGQWDKRTVNQILWTPDSKALVGVGYQGLKIRGWSIPDGNDVGDLEGHTAPVRSAAFNSDASLLVSGSNDRTVRLWSVQSGTLLRTLKGHTDQVTSVAFSPDGATVASGSDDGTVRLWRVWC